MPEKLLILREAGDSFAANYRIVGFDSSKILLKGFLNKFEKVDSAYVDSFYNFIIKWKNEEDHEVLFLDPPLSEKELERQKHYHDSVLIKEAFSFERAVRNKKLLIITDPGNHYQSNAI
jgi:hypothetical protein